MIIEDRELYERVHASRFGCEFKELIELAKAGEAERDLWVAAACEVIRWHGRAVQYGDTERFNAAIQALRELVIEHSGKEPEVYT